MSPSHRVPDPAGLLREALPGSGTAAAWQPPPVGELAGAFPEVVIHELIGQGGMAAVYRASQTRLDRTVALKVMRPDLAGQPQFAERFLREARALATLSNEHVLAIHDFGERSGFCYLVTEFVDGANLRELMQLGRLSPAEVLRIVPQVCAALHFAHAHGVVHRDIKPENVLVDRDGRVKLADFGLAKLAGDPSASTFTRTGQVFGTPHYMAPEQWHGSAGVDHRADIYALGVLLYELLTGRLPVGTYAPASQQPGVPAGIDPIVQRSLQHEPEQRYQSARDVQHDLERQRAAAGTPAGNGATGSGRAGRWLAAALAVLFLGGGAIGWFVYTEFGLMRMRGWLRENDETNVRVAAEIAATVARGEAWTGDVPRAFPPMREGPLTEGVRTTVAIGGGFAVLLATVLLVAVAWRRTRAAGTSRVVHVVAGLVLTAPFVIAAGALLGWYPALAGYEHTPRPALPFFTGAPLAVIVLWLLWRASARRTVGPAATARVGWPTRSGLGACALTLLYCALLLVQAPRRPPWVPTARLPVLADELVGSSRIALLERLGPPRKITASTGTMFWNYERLDATGQNALLLTNGVVTGVQRDNRPVVHLVPEPIPATAAFPGQTVQELMKALGPAIDSTVSTNGSELRFDGGITATVSADGIALTVLDKDGRPIHQR